MNVSIVNSDRNRYNVDVHIDGVKLKGYNFIRNKIFKKYRHEPICLKFLEASKSQITIW